MDSSSYENSDAILDQSAWQVAEFWMTSCNLDVYSFFDSKNIGVQLTSSTAKELGYQSYNPSLLSGSSTSALSNDKENYVLSSLNGSLTFQTLDSQGYPVNIVDSSTISPSFQQSLWNMSPAFQRMKRKVLEKGKGKADLEIIFLAESFAKEAKSFFIFTNDNDLVQHSKLEGFLYLRPIGLLLWMVADKYISRQKAVWVFEKMKKHDLMLIDKKRPYFKDYLS